jgi:L,D-transpeptidase YbiS
MLFGDPEFELEEQPPRPRLGRRIVRALPMALAAGLVVLVLLAALGGRYVAVPAAEVAAAAASDGPGRPAQELRALAPRGVYLVVDSFDNRLRVYRNGRLLREAVVSSGSGAILRDPQSGREWVFDTPRGERVVERKVKNPIWVKPDWAFIEEGYLPPEDPKSRYDDFSLGDYALYIGDGYILHGTLFQTLLGKSVTHGCIRVGDADLRFLYRHVPVGARVYLY